MTEQSLKLGELTARELIVIDYLSPLMEASAHMIGRRLWEAMPGNGSNLPALGAAVVGRLKRRELVYRLPDLNAWRLTASGRQLAQNRKHAIREGGARVAPSAPVVGSGQRSDADGEGGV